MSKVKKATPLAYASALNGKCFLSLHTVLYEDKNGKERPYFMCTRGMAPTGIYRKEDGFSKYPDAVVIVGITDHGQVVVTKEFRVPINDYELSFPAGLIDQKDFDQSDSIEGAAKIAAIREFKEETGMNFEPKECSPTNLYSSAGMTDESVCIVIGRASGEISHNHQEDSEDISVMLLQREQIISIMDDQSHLFSKVAWPFLWAFKIWGVPKL